MHAGSHLINLGVIKSLRNYNTIYPYILADIFTVSKPTVLTAENVTELMSLRHIIKRIQNFVN